MCHVTGWGFILAGQKLKLGFLLYKLYRYVWCQRVWFFEPFWSEIGYRF